MPLVYRNNWDFGLRSRRARRYARRPRYNRNRFNKRSHIRKAVRREIESYAEKMYFPAPSNLSVSSTPNVVSLSDVAQGDADTNRDGDQLSLTSIEFRGYIATGDTTNVLRFIIFQWYPNDSFYPPTASDILLTAASGFISPYSHDGRFQFKILYDRSFSMSTNWQPYLTFHKYVTKGFRRKIQYNAGGTTGVNKIYLLLVSDSSAAPHPTISYYSKLNYRDT